MKEQAQVLELLVMTDHVLWEVLDTLRTHDLNENTLAVSFEARLCPSLARSHLYLDCINSADQTWHVGLVINVGVQGRERHHSLVQLMINATWCRRL